MLFRDDHRFSLLHWASREGRTNIVDMLIQRGARINATNMGDDTALHLAASHGHRDILLMVSRAAGQPRPSQPWCVSYPSLGCLWRVFRKRETLRSPVEVAVEGASKLHGDTRIRPDDTPVVEFCDSVPEVHDDMTPSSSGGRVYLPTG